VRRVVLGLLLLAACGGPTRNAAEVTIAGQGAPPPPSAQAPVAPLDATMPENAAATLVLDPAVLARTAKGFFTHADGSPSNEQRDLEDELDVGKGALAHDRILDTLGIDASRSIAGAVAHLDAAGQARVARLDAIAAKLGEVPSDTMRVDFGELLRAYGTEPGFTRLRLRLPVVDASRAKRALRHLLGTAGLRERTATPGVDFVMSGRQMTIAATADPAWLVADLYFGGGDAPGPEVLASIVALRVHGEQGGEPAPLQDHLARVLGEPRMIAELAFVRGVQQTMAAVDKVDPDVRDRIAAAGLVEAHRALELSRNERGPYFRNVSATLDERGGGWRARLEAYFGAGFEAKAKAAANLPSERGVAVADARSFLDVSVASGLAFPMPGDGPGGPGDERVFTRMIREAGWAGWLISAPLAPLYLMSLPVRPPPDAFEPRSAALKLTRVAIVEPDAPRGELFVGTLRAGASEADAACVLAGAVPCARRALRVNGPAVKMGSKFARVTKVGDRFAIITGDEAANVDTFKPAALRSVSPLEAMLPKDAFRGPEAALLFGSREGRPIRFTASPILGDSIQIEAIATPP